MAEEARRKHDVTVIGAGVVGVATALTLQLDGHRVTLVDPREPGSVTSFGNAGGIVTSGITPVATPGLWKRVPSMLLDPMSPLALRWRYLPKLMPWLARFLAAGTRANASRIAAEMAPLTTRAFAAHQKLARESGGGGLLKPVGWLEIHRDEAALAEAAFELEMMDAAGIGYEVLDANQLHQLEPGLSRDYACAVFHPDSGFVSTPFALTQSYLRAFVANGGRLLQEEARRFEMGADGPTRLVTDRGMHDIDQVVIAAGAWSKRLAADLAAPVPLETERGYHLNLAWNGSRPILRRPTVVADLGFVLCPMADGLRLTAGVELAGLDAPPDFSRIRRLLPLARAVLPGLSGEVEREWMGYRPSLPDSKPVIGRSQRFANAWFAFGHGHMGLTLSAVTGRLIADAMAGRPERVPLAPFRAERF